MGRAPCCDKANVKKGPWSPEEEAKLKEYVDKNGTGGNWIAFPQKAGLRRCGKSCRLRWLNYLRPNIRHGEFSDDEDRIICTLFASIGSRWSIIAAQLPGRTDNDIKNYWNTKLKKKLFAMVQSRKKSQQIHHGSFASILKSSSPSSPSSTLLYNCSNTTFQTPPTSFSCSNNTYQTPPTSFSCFEPSYSSSFSNSSASCVSAERYQVHDNGVQVFRGEVSCSTSDASCSNGDHQQSGIQSYSNFYTDESHRVMIMTPNGDHGADGWSDHQKSLNGLWGENEEIKQIISSTSSCNSFVFDENKAYGKVMYYY